MMLDNAERHDGAETYEQALRNTLAAMLEDVWDAQDQPEDWLTPTQEAAVVERWRQRLTEAGLISK